MTFRIVGLDPTQFAPLWRGQPDALAAAAAERVLVTQKHRAPCRVSLDDAEAGEEVLLLSFPHLPHDTAYRQQGPIFVRKGVDRFDRVGAIPPAFARRTLSLRAFDATHRMVDADLTEGEAAEALIARMFERPDVAYLHAHYARRGCFAGEIRRA